VSAFVPGHWRPGPGRTHDKPGRSGTLPLQFRGIRMASIRTFSAPNLASLVTISMRTVASLAGPHSRCGTGGPVLDVPGQQQNRIVHVHVYCPQHVNGAAAFDGMDDGQMLVHGFLW
jgi:hypothetical protein